MSENVTPMHFVCTLEEASQLINQHREYWVCNCGCREGRGGCGRSRMDLCLTFYEDAPVTGSARKKISAGDVDAIIAEARRKYLVPRPFRDMKTRTVTQGVCFCCDDCCSYFLNPEETCDKGRLIETTDLRRCTHCGDCVKVCYFGARSMQDDALMIDSDRCFGCGVCVESCPTDCIEMIGRN